MSSSPALVPGDLLAVWPGDGPAVQYSTVQYSTVQYSDGPAVRGLLHLAAEGVGHPRPGLGLGLVVPLTFTRYCSFHLG